MNKFVMFDLDGTLIDSVGGIVNSVNETRKKYGYAPLPAEKVAKVIPVMEHVFSWNVVLRGRNFPVPWMNL